MCTLPTRSRAHAVLARAARSLPEDVLKHIVAFVPIKTRAIVESGIQEFSKALLLDPFGTQQRLPLKAFVRLTLCTKKAAKTHWKSHKDGMLWREVIVHHYRDYWYQEECVVYMMNDCSRSVFEIQQGTQHRIDGTNITVTQLWPDKIIVKEFPRKTTMQIVW